VSTFLADRRQASNGTPAARAGDRVDRRADDLGLFFGRHFVEATGVALIVSHPFPAALLALLDDFRMVDADIAVECDGRANPVAIENLHEPENADPVAVVAHRPDRNVGNLAGAEAARARLEREEFNIGHHPQCHACTARPVETWPSDDRRVWKGTVGTGFHETRTRAVDFKFLS
jgi:hypothetical protein